MDGRMSPTEGVVVVERPFTLLLLLFPGRDHTHWRLYDDTGERVPDTNSVGIDLFDTGHLKVFIKRTVEEKLSK